VATETAAAKQRRAYRAVRYLGSATPAQLADRMNAACEVYPKLGKVTKTQAEKLLKDLHKEDLLAKAGGDSYKLKEGA